MPDPEDKDNLIDLYFDFTSKPKIDVSIVNGSPYIKIKIKANATISSIKQLSNKNTEDQIKLTQSMLIITWKDYYYIIYIKLQKN